MVGSSFPYSEFLPKEGQARGVQIDIAGRMLGIRYPMEVNLVGDSKETLRALIPRLKRKDDRSWRDELEEGVRDWWKLMEERALQDADPINPQRVFWELSKRLPERAILAADSGSSARARSAPPTRSSRPRTSSARASRRRSSAGRCSRTTCPS